MYDVIPPDSLYQRGVEAIEKNVLIEAHVEIWPVVCEYPTGTVPRRKSEKYGVRVYLSKYG